MSVATLIFYALCLVWAGSEAWLSWRKRATASEAHDAGTLRVLWLVLGAAMFIGMFFAFTDLARFAPAWRGPALWTDLALMAAGLGLRWWSVGVLAQQFTVNVAIRDGHLLVREGPYAWVRHPSYNGALMTFLGCGLACGNWISLTVLTLPVALAFMRRIRVEEAVLAQAFPHDYPVYARSTGRLIPRRRT